MQIGGIRQFLLDLGWRESLVVHHDPLRDVVVPDEGGVCLRVDHIPWEDLGTDRFHQLDIVREEDGDVLGPLLA